VKAKAKSHYINDHEKGNFDERDHNGFQHVNVNGQGWEDFDQKEGKFDGTQYYGDG
jgi:hypothetical protein